VNLFAFYLANFMIGVPLTTFFFLFRKMVFTRSNQRSKTPIAPQEDLGLKCKTFKGNMCFLKRTQEQMQSDCRKI